MTSFFVRLPIYLSVSRSVGSIFNRHACISSAETLLFSTSLFSPTTLLFSPLFHPLHLSCFLFLTALLSSTPLSFTLLSSPISISLLTSSSLTTQRLAQAEQRLLAESQEREKARKGTELQQEICEKKQKISEFKIARYASLPLPSSPFLLPLPPSLPCLPYKSLNCAVLTL